MDQDNIFKLIRKSTSLNQEQMCKKLGFRSKSYISEIENEKKNITINIVEAYAKYIGIMPSDILSIKEKMENQSTPDDYSENMLLITTFINRRMKNKINQ